MRRRAGVLGAAFVLQHVPDLVRYGSKPSREGERLTELAGALRSYEQALAYPPHQVFVGNLRPEQLWDRPRPWWREADGGGARVGPYGELMPQGEFYELLAELDQFDLVRPGAEADGAEGELALLDGGEPWGAFARAHDRDESLTAAVLLENLCCKASGVHALRFLLARAGVEPARVEYALGCGEEAVGDRYQRGGGALVVAHGNAFRRHGLVGLVG